VRAILIKETTQVRRERMTYAMVMVLPVIQLILFGFAINIDPKGLPTVAVVSEPSPFSRSVVAAMENSGYFRITAVVESEDTADALLARGDALFMVAFPPGFARALMRGERPQLLVAADATDPLAVAMALSAFNELAGQSLRHDLVGVLAPAVPPQTPYELILHRRYNPENITQYNIVPGLIGVVLTFTGIMLTAFAITRENERGTMENLLAMPVTPIEVMLGKIIPYIALGYIQTLVILGAAAILFSLPMLGSYALMALCLLVFIATNVALGYTFSTIARNQLQAMQMSFFFVLPSILLSGFMFPFRGMPGWAQVLGEALPLTHFMRIVRGIMLKGNGMAEIWPNLWPLFVIFFVIASIAVARFRRTLD